MAPARTSLIIVGGGLAGGLAALALARWRPEVTVTIIERAERIGGNHLWSFFDSDAVEDARLLAAPLVGHRWLSYDVRFPAYKRALAGIYNSIESEALDAAVRAALPPRQVVQARATRLAATGVTLEDGRVLNAEAVIDGRGFDAPPEGLVYGWQKFVGQLLHVPTGHGLSEPIIMDATVDQADGYRFVYCLPFDRTHVFVEDTYYADRPALEAATLSQRIAAYAEAQGWTVESVSRSEAGVLPVVIGGDFDGFWPASDEVARVGVRGGFFHPLTSYSLPDALRFAVWLAREAPLDDTLGAASRRRALAHWESSKFDRLLARMLFRAADPPERYRVLERFYRLPPSLIARFYAGRSTLRDRIRILAGRPPVSIRRAVGAMLETS